MACQCGTQTGEASQAECGCGTPAAPDGGCGCGTPSSETLDVATLARLVKDLDQRVRELEAEAART